MIKKTCIVLLILSGCALLSACQATTFGRPGAQADEQDHIVMLSSLPLAEGRLNDYYAEIAYRAEQQGAQLELTGTFDFSTNSQVYTRRLHGMTLLLFLLDEDLRVIASRDLAEAPINGLEDTLKFSREVELPDGTTAFALGYRILTVDDEGYQQIVEEGPSG